MQGGPRHRVRIVVTADPDPGLLLRLASVLRASNALPLSLRLARREDGLAVIEADLVGPDRALTMLILGKLEQLVDVHEVAAHIGLPAVEPSENAPRP